MLLLLGVLLKGLVKGWDDELMKDAKKSGDVGDMFAASAGHILYQTIRYSTLDFNWINAITETAYDWNPFSISYLSNTLGYAWDMVTGDMDASKFISKSFSAARQFKPFITWLNSDKK